MSNALRKDPPEQNQDDNLEKDPYHSKLIRSMPFIPANQFLYDRKGPWPQPAPFHPFGMSPAVVHLPFSEWWDFQKHVGLRYAKQLLLDTPKAFLFGMTNHITDTSPEEFAELFYNTIFCKLLNSDLNERIKKLFAPVMETNASYYKVDLSVMEHVLPYSGQFTSPCIALFKKIGQRIHCEAIHINGILIKSTDGEAFELAKYYVIQGACNVVTLTIHPLLHLPYDTINAITKTALPKDHLIHKIIMPHTRFTLQLNRTVTLSEESILRNWRHQIYGCYPGPSEGLQDLFVAAYNGIENNTSYPPFKLPNRPPSIPTPYGEFLQRYYDTIYTYVDAALKTQHLEKNCPYVKSWAEYISHWTKGFPNGEEIFSGDNLTTAVAMYIWDVSVAHSLDHYSFGNLPMDKVLMRMRIAPPTSSELPTFKRSKLVTGMDTMKFEMAQKMFYRPTTVTRLMDVDCQFKQPELIKLNNRFRFDLMQTAKELQDNEQIPLAEIAASVQY